MQVWSGLFVKAAPGWSLLIRPPVNLPRSQSFECYEGILEADRWFGPLFINLRLTATDRPIEINHKKPLLQVQPLLRETYSEKNLRAFRIVDELDALSPGGMGRLSQDRSSSRTAVTIARSVRMPRRCASGDGSTTETVADSEASSDETLN